MRCRSLALFLLTGCCHTASASLDVPWQPNGPTFTEEPEEPTLPRAILVPEWKNLPDAQALLATREPEPPDPTTSLAWPAPPTTVGCIVRGTGEPFPDPCGAEYVTVRSRGTDIAFVDPTSAELVWGIPRSPARHGGLWMHARHGGLSVTGHAGRSVRFELRREVMVVENRVWAKKGAPVVPRYAEAGVTVAIQDPEKGVEDIRAAVGCDDLGFDPPDNAAVAAPPEEAPTDETERPEPVLRYASGDALPLLTEPGGERITTLRATTERTISVEMTVVETRGAFSRVTFETQNARFDVWVANSQISEEALMGFGTIGYGCGRSSGGMGSSSTMHRASKLHLGKDAPNPVATESLEIAEGAPYMPGETKDGFMHITPLGSAIHPAGDMRFWVLESDAREPPVMRVITIFPTTSRETSREDPE